MRLRSKEGDGTDKIRKVEFQQLMAIGQKKATDRSKFVILMSCAKSKRLSAGWTCDGVPLSSGPGTKSTTPGDVERGKKAKNTSALSLSAPLVSPDTDASRLPTAGPMRTDESRLTMRIISKKRCDSAIARAGQSIFAGDAQVRAPFRLGPHENSPLLREVRCGSRALCSRPP